MTCLCQQGSGLNAAQLEAIGLSLDANGNVDFTSAAVKELLKKPKVTITRTVKEGVITRTVEKDFTGVAPSAAAMEAGIGVQIDAEGLPVDRCFWVFSCLRHSWVVITVGLSSQVSCERY
jgi:hypothetical protein